MYGAILYGPPEQQPGRSMSEKTHVCVKCYDGIFRAWYMKPTRTRRHVWHERDYCITCGVRRDGYSGGRTGGLTYTWPGGRQTASAGECPGADPLGAAVAFVETHHPLPRCPHGHALRDHGGERLSLPCGCVDVRAMIEGRRDA